MRERQQKKAEAEQKLFKAALENPALAGRVLHNNKMYQDPSEGPCILLVNDAILSGEIECHARFPTPGDADIY